MSTGRFGGAVDKAPAIVNWRPQRRIWAGCCWTTSKAEHEHARAMLYGIADDTDDARLVSRLNRTSHVLEQTEALVAQVAAEPDGDS